MTRSPYIVIGLGVLVMAYSLVHVDTYVAGHLITDLHVFIAGFCLAVMCGFRELLADAELTQRWKF